MQGGVVQMQPVMPMAQVYPAFASVQYVPVPTMFSSAAAQIDPQLWGFLETANAFSVRRHVKLLPKACCACPPCVPQEESFSIYAGLNTDSMMEVLRADEVSNDCNRCCCKPNHPFKLEVRQYVPVPGDSVNSDFAHLSQELRNDWSRLTGGQKQSALLETYKRMPVLFTIQREDGQRCIACPCRCLSCFVCCGCCQDGVTVHAGTTVDMEGEKGRWVNGPVRETMLGSVKQPCGGGMCHPEWHIRDGGADETADPFAKIDGPCFFGGWSELCCDFKFFTSYFKSPTGTGDVALIVKKKPQSMGGVAQDFLTGDYSNYEIQYNMNTKLSAGQKLTVLAGQMLVDYALFDGKTEKCHADDQGITCYCCYCMIIGCLWPCYIFIPTKGG